MDLKLLVERYNENTEGRTIIPELEAYRLLWIKVILRAIYDYVLYENSKNKSLRDIGISAKKWLFEKPKAYENMALPNLCLELGLDVEKIRECAQSLTRDKIVKIEFLNRNKKNDR